MADTPVATPSDSVEEFDSAAPVHVIDDDGEFTYVCVACVLLWSSLRSVGAQSCCCCCCCCYVGNDVVIPPTILLVARLYERY
jgi:hypothetical protein